MDDGDRCPCLARDSVSQDEKITDGLVMEVFRAPGVGNGKDDGALSGQMDQPTSRVVYGPVPKVVGHGG